MKTKYSSFCNNGIAKGCKYCVKGEKLVLFISGICSRNCYYCSLSEKRKNKDIIYCNERICKNPKDAIKEAIESNATSMGITGGDPLLYINRTIQYAKALKQKFGKKFHIHIYLPTKLVTDDKIKRLSRYVDEVRFHPEFLVNTNPDLMELDINKIKNVLKYYKKENIGIELPMIPDKKKEILDFILRLKDYIGFVNFNEFELSETNMNIIEKRYKLNPGGYTIKESIRAGKWILDQLNRKKVRLNVHLCTAELKNNYQFKNRLLLHNILPYGYRTKDGTVKYLVIEKFDKKIINYLKAHKLKYYIDKPKNRIILEEKSAQKLLRIMKNKKINIKVNIIEEFPTFDRIEVEKEEIV